MASGNLGSIMTVANTTVNPYTVPGTAQFATVSISCVNTSATEDATVKIYITDQATPAVQHCIEYNAVIPANGGVLERTCIVCSANEKVYVESNTASVAVRVYGLEQL